jgi:hypothetical protein
MNDLILNLDTHSEGSTMNIINNPFCKNLITHVHMHYFPSSGWSSTVAFKNGLTKGEQGFEDKDFDSLVVRMNSFIKNLETL